MFGTSGSLSFPMAYELNHHGSPPESRSQLGGKRNCCGSQKCLWLGLGVVVALLIGLAIATTIIGVQFAELKHQAIELGNFSSNSSHPYPGWNQCLEMDCVLTSAKVKNALDETTSPCKDFYQFACGGWIKKNPIPVSSGQWGQFEVIRSELFTRMKEILEEEPYDEESNDTESRFPDPLLTAQQFYEVCRAQETKDSTTIPEFVTWMDEVLEISNITSHIANLGSILGSLRREVAGDYIFQLFVSLNETNTTANIIYLDQPNLGLNREYLLDQTETGILFRNSYHSLVSQAWSIVYPQDEPTSETIATDIINFEIALANSSMSPENRRNKSELYNPMTLADLYNITRRNAGGRVEQIINWQQYFTEVFKILLTSDFFDPSSTSTTIHDMSEIHLTEFDLNGTYYNAANLTSNETDYFLSHSFHFNFSNITYVVRDVPYFQQLATNLNRFRVITLADYLKWRVIADYGKEVSYQIRRLFFQFEQRTNGVRLPAAFWRECVDRANYYFGMAISYRYVDKYIDDVTLYKAKSLVADIMSIFQDMLQSSDWLDYKTKERATQKARKMKVFVGYPNWLKNWTILDEYYHGLEFSSPENHFFNMVDLAKWLNRKNLAQILTTKRNDWITDPTVVNAFYSPIYNSINFPAGILQPPFFGMPLAALNYGAIGAIIGHEITHGFDDRGSQNDAEGNLHNWWEAATFTNYFEKSACFVEQYSNYTVPEANMTINGLMTLSENIADNGGVRQAYRAYKRFQANQPIKEKLLPGLAQYTSEQLFFISYAQIQCETHTHANMIQQIQTAEHSPSKWRVNGVVANSKDFAQAWNCLRPPRINNSTLCELW